MTIPGLIDRFASLPANPIRQLLLIADQPGMISFAGGLPSPELFPVEELKRASEDALSRHGASALQYAPTPGIRPLREEIARMESTDQYPVSPDEVLITTGAQQALDLIARVFIQPGDVILTESPTYVGALHTFNQYGAKYVDLPMDHEGIRLEQLEEMVLRHRPKFIYVIPSFQNPTGVSLSVERRTRLVEIARRHSILILDDDPYARLGFGGEMTPTLRQLGGDGVIALRSFSKTVTPGMRVGWTQVSGELFGILERAKQGADLHSSSFAQYTLLSYLQSGGFCGHVERIRADYGKKCQLMIQELEKHFPDRLQWTHPAGGMFIWVTGPGSLSMSSILPDAIQAKVLFVPGKPFFPEGNDDRSFRLNFSNASHERILEGMKRLAEVFASRV